MEKNEQKLNMNRNKNQEMVDWWNKKQIRDKIDGIRENITNIEDKAYELMLKRNINYKEDAVEDENTADLMVFFGGELRDGLKKIRKDTDEIERLIHNLKQEKGEKDGINK